MGREGAPWQSHVFLCHRWPPQEAGPGIHSAPRALAVHSSTQELLLPTGCVKWSAALGWGPAPGLSPDPWPLRTRSRWSYGCGPTAGRRRSAPAAARAWAPTWRSRARSAGRARPCCGQPCSAFPPCGQKRWLKAGPGWVSPARPPLPWPPSTHFLQTCWEPLRYSCSKAGRTSWWRLKRLCSMRVSAGVGGSRHSGMNTMKDRGSGELSSSFCAKGPREGISGLHSRPLALWLASQAPTPNHTPTSK